MLWYLTLVSHTQSQVGYFKLVILKVQYIVGHTESVIWFSLTLAPAAKPRANVNNLPIYVWKPPSNLQFLLVANIFGS